MNIVISKTCPLKLIIRSAPHVFMGVLHEAHHRIRSVSLTHPQRKPLSQSLNCTLPLEGREPSIEHQSDSIDQLVGVRSQGEERFDSQMLEHAVTL